MNIVYQKSITLNSSLAEKGISVNFTRNDKQIKSFTVSLKLKSQRDYEISNVALSSINYYLKQLNFEPTTNQEYQKLIKTKNQYKAFLLGFATYLSFFELVTKDEFKKLLPLKFFIPVNIDDGDCHHYHI